MKSVTEFWIHAINKGLAAKTALAAEGKSPEEIQTSLGETMKFEGDKLKYFVNALEVAGQNMEKLSRVLVVSLAEGETAPPKAIKMEEMHYIPEFQSAPLAVNLAKKTDSKNGPGGKGRGKSNTPKSSPWGLTPEEKAAKKGGGKSTPKPS